LAEEAIANARSNLELTRHSRTEFGIVELNQEADLMIDRALLHLGEVDHSRGVKR